MGVTYSRITSQGPYLDIQRTKPCSHMFSNLCDCRGVIIYPNGNTYYYEDPKSEGLQDKLHAGMLIGSNEKMAVEDLLTSLHEVSHDNGVLQTDSGNYVYSVYYPGRLYNSRTRFTDAQLISRCNNLVLKLDPMWYRKMGLSFSNN